MLHDPIANKNRHEPRKQLIDKAVAVSNHEEQDVLLDETLDFIRFTMEHIGDSHF